MKDRETKFWRESNMKPPINLIKAKDVQIGQEIVWFMPRVGEPAECFCGEVLEEPEEAESKKSGSPKVLLHIAAFDLDGKSVGIVKAKLYPNQLVILSDKATTEETE